jgi:hypothetical protein
VRGSALVEVAVATSAVSAIVTGSLGALYLSFAIVWIERESYEALICMAARNSSPSACETRMRRRSAGALPIGEFTHLVLARTQRSVRIEANFAISGHETVRHRDTRSLPLRWDEHGGKR